MRPGGRTQDANADKISSGFHDAVVRVRQTTTLNSGRRKVEQFGLRGSADLSHLIDSWTDPVDERTVFPDGAEAVEANTVLQIVEFLTRELEELLVARRDDELTGAEI